MRAAAWALVGLGVGAGSLACQSYNMEGVDPQTVVAVETSGTFTAGKPPALLIVLDRSGSMEICFGEGGEPGQRCDSNGNGRVDSDGQTRMHVAQRVMNRYVTTHGPDVLFGLSLYGVEGEDPACGDPLVVETPGPDTTAAVANAFLEHPAIVQPRGGTPTTKALRGAYDMMVGADGKPRMEDRANYVVLVTDGLMNCNFDHQMPCFCANESGCPTVDGAPVPFGGHGTFVDGRFCLDDDASVSAVLALREAGVKTFVLGVGDSFFLDEGADLGFVSLNRLADAGGMPRGGDEKFYSAADEQQLEEALSEIVGRIVVPCEYELEGPVCDGRLLSITMEVDGERIPTTCGEGGTDQWHFASGPDGRLDPRRITFSDDLCRRFERADSVRISIKGIESGCAYEDGVAVGPACDLRTLE